MARGDSNVDVHKNKKQRSTTTDVQPTDSPSQQTYAANVRKLGDPSTSTPADPNPGRPSLDAEMSDLDDPNFLPSLDPEAREMMRLADDVQRCILDIDSIEVSEAFVSADDEPPITLNTLAELEMPRILSNPKLRQDINFDRDLHFRPNLEGPRGMRKMRKTDIFWKALIGELSMYARVQQELARATSTQKEEYWGKIQATSEKRLPSIFMTIQDILFTLVPLKDHHILEQRLDADLLMQEIKNGVCDLVGLAEWMAAMLKCHCAPMRDVLVDEMCRTIVKGATEGRSDTLVHGIRQLLTILEAMKLDVANHQIRFMRPALVTDTVRFMRPHNATCIAEGKIHVREAQDYMRRELEIMVRNGESPNYLAALTSALLRNLVLNNDYSKMWPDTFCLDAERLKHISHMLHMGIYQQVCGDILRDMTVRLNVSAFTFGQACSTLKGKVTSITGTTYKFFERIEYIAAEIMRIVLELEGKAGTTDVDLLQEIERRLEADLCTMNTAVYENLGMSVIRRVLPKLQRSVAAHFRKGALEVMDLFVPMTPNYYNQPAPTSGHGAHLVPVAANVPVDEDDDVVRRLTHILTLHWQVWAELVYLAPLADDMVSESESSSDDSSAPSSRSASPLDPLLGDVYEPGHKFFPSGSNASQIPSTTPTPANASVNNEASGHLNSTAGQDQGDSQSKRPTIDPEL